MSLHHYEISKELEASDLPFYALLMAAIRRADSDNMAKFRACWPEIVDELQARYDAPGGRLPTDDQDELDQAESDARRDGRRAEPTDRRRDRPGSERKNEQRDNHD